MKRSWIPIGVLIAVLLLAEFLPHSSQKKQTAEVSGGSSSSSSDPNSLYALVKKQVAAESSGDASDVIKEFTKDLIKQRKLATPALTDDDIVSALQGNYSKLCSGERKEVMGDCEGLGVSVIGIAGRETSVQELGRELQAIATSYELPLQDGLQGGAGVTSPLTGILNIWRVRTPIVDTATGSLLQRSVLVSTDDSKPKAKNIADAFENFNDNKAINAEQQNAAVWRYSAGIRLVRNDRKNFPAPQEVGNGEVLPERQYLFKRWESLESPLLSLWNTVSTQKFDPPLKPGEIAILTFSREGMPDNVQLWGYVEKGKKENDPIDGDIGISWALPLEPVFPSLLQDSGNDPTPILGGIYPPEPVMARRTGAKPQPMIGGILCAGPTARFGYLCNTPTDESICKEKADVPPDTIVLTACTEPNPKAAADTSAWCCLPKKDGDPNRTENTCSAMEKDACEQAGGKSLENQNQCKNNGCETIDQGEQKPTRQTVAGPDACQDFSWMTSKPKCEDVKIECDTRDADTFGADDDFKWEGTTLTVKLLKQKHTAYSDILAHALTHAVQSCGPTPSSYTKDGEKFSELKNLSKEEQKKRVQACCRTEGEAFANETLTMERNGKLKNAGSADGVPLNATTLAEGLTDWECTSFFPQTDGCSTSFEYTPEFENSMWVFMNKVANDPKAPSCEDVVKKANADPAVQGMIAAAEGPHNVCQPGVETMFPNTIGNSLCLLGTCIENSAELRNTIPGRTAMTTQDQAQPFEADMKPLSLAADFLNGIPDSSLTIPAYRPALLLEQQDADLCQLVGSPLRFPSVRCALDGERQLQYPLQDYMNMTQNIQKASDQQKQAIWQQESLEEDVGIRIGTALYARVLDHVGHTLHDVVEAMNALLSAMQKTSFPTNMCAIGGAPQE